MNLATAAAVLTASNMTSTIKAILVNPPFQYFLTTVPSLDYKRPPLGILYLASYAKMKLDLEVDILDAYAENLSVEETLAKLKKFPHEIIGFSVTTPTVFSVRDMIESLRKDARFRDSLFVVGGPHVTLSHEELAPVADISVVGEGEETFVDIVKYRRGELRISDIKGIIYRSDSSEVVVNAPRELLPDLDRLPPPYRSKIKRELYGHIFPYEPGKGVFTTIFTSRGCNFSCTFCGNERLWKNRVRSRSIGNVIGEIEKLLSDGYRLLFFDDDNLLSSREFAYGLLQEIVARGLEFKWVCHARVAAYEDRLLNLMSQAGCVEVQIGVESFNQKALKAANKKIRVERIGECICRFQQRNINVWATMIIGLPEEDVSSLERSVDRLIEADPFYATFILLLPFPGTRIFDLYKERGYIITEDWSKYSWHGEPVFRTDRLSTGDMMGLRKRAYRNFYLRPRTVVKYLPVLYKYNMYGPMLKNLLRFIYFSFPGIVGKKAT
jgi:anaerobic magnesium-protoporphyrin IX monomethyl ester cyclase